MPVNRGCTGKEAVRWVSVMRCHGNSGTPRQQQQQQQAVDFGDEEEELLRDHEQSLRQLEVGMMWMLACTQHSREQFSSDY